jgi:hypothetical protein
MTTPTMPSITGSILRKNTRSGSVNGIPSGDSLWAVLVRAEIRKLAKRGVKFSKALLHWAGI